MSSQIIRLLFLAALLAPSHRIPSAAASNEPKPGAMLYVARDGNAAWAGTLARPNANKTNGPLATLEDARQKIRAIRKHRSLPKGGVTVVVRGGTYCLAKTFQLDQADSGSADSPIVYRAADGENVQVIGGRPITGFTPHHDSILKASVAGQGFQGFYFRQLFFDGHRQHLARYPNFDPQNPYGGGWAYVDGKVIDNIYQEAPGADKRTLHYKEADSRTWSRPTDGEVFIFPRYNWWNNIVPIATIDRDTRTLTLSADTSYAVRPGDRYYVQNQLEELDAPGEWYLDRNAETLYFWPPAPLEGKKVYAPALRTLIAIGPGASHLTIRGLTLECCDGNAIVLNETADCLVAGNTIRNVGDYHGSGVVVTGGRRNGVVGNDISEVGRHGISLGGGDRNTLTPGGNYADNNYIHHIGVFHKQGIGVEMSGVANRVSHNLIHDGPRTGIVFSGNNLIVEYNHIRHVDLETEDSGAVHTGGRDWISSRGSCIRYNYFHDIRGYGRANGKWISPYFARGVYLDDNSAGIDVIGNIVARVAESPLMLHNACDTHIENNIFIDGAAQQVLYQGWWKRTKPGNSSFRR